MQAPDDEIRNASTKSVMCSDDDVVLLARSHGYADRNAGSGAASLRAVPLSVIMTWRAC